MLTKAAHTTQQKTREIKTLIDFIDKHHYILIDN